MPIASASFTLLNGLWAVSWQATVLVGVVLVVRAIFGQWIGPPESAGLKVQRPVSVTSTKHTAVKNPTGKHS